jgi:hypothetical protein
VSRNGQTYVAVSATTNETPETSPTKWSLMAQKGADATAANIAAGSITGGNGSGHLASRTVNAANIVLGTITTSEIAASAGIKASQLATGDTDGIKTANIASNAITTAKIGANQVTGGKIGTGLDGVTTDNIVDATITTTDIAAAAGIKGSQLATGLNGVATANIVDGAITTAKIGDAQVTGAKVATGASGITAANIVDATITTTDIAAAAGIRGSQLATGLNGVATANIVDGAITTAKIGDNQVTAAKVADNSLGAADVAKAEGTITLTAGNANVGFNSCTTAPSGVTQTTTINTGSIPANARIVLVETTVPTNNGVGPRNWRYYPLPSGVTAGANGTGKVTLSVCNFTGGNAIPGPMTFEFLAFD